MRPEPLWHVFGQSVRGASHVRADLPNQDAILWRPASGMGLPLILVVSDGHGSAKSFRSDRGSAIACSVTADLLEELVEGLPNPQRLSVVKRAAEDRLPKELVRRWWRAVDRDLSEEPCTDGELAALKVQRGEKGVAQVAENPRLAYGATVLGVLVTQAYLLFLQLGDGDILAVSDEGEVTRPLARDARLIANETTSLCMPEAWVEVRLRFRTNFGELPALILAATDGYANSFVNDAAFCKVGSDILAIMRKEGVENVEERLPDWLQEASAAGSGDDISLGIVYRLDAVEDTQATLEPSEVTAPAATQKAALQASGRGDDEEPAPVHVSADLRARFVAQIKHQGPSEPAKQVRLADAIAGRRESQDPDAPSADASGTARGPGSGDVDASDDAAEPR